VQHELIQHELPGKAELLMVHTPGAVSSYLGSYVRSGMAFAPRKLYELSHLLEHLAFEGTKRYPDPLEFKSAVEQNGAYFNAYTADYLNWYEMVGESAEVERLLPLATSQLYEPLFEPKRINQQQETVDNELRRYRENDGHRLRYYSSQHFVPTWYPDMNDRIAMTLAITREDLVGFHSEHYGTANTTFVVAGDFSVKRQKGLVKQLGELLEGHREARKHELQVPPFRKNFGGHVAAYKPCRDMQASFLLRSKVLEHDVTAAGVLRLISGMYTSGLSSRMNMKAREAGLTYSISSGSALNVHDTDFFVSSETDIERIKPLVELSMSELSDLASGNFSDAELERSKSYVSGMMRRSFETPSSLARWYGDDIAVGRELISPIKWVAILHALDRATIIQVSKRYFNMRNMTLTLIGAGLEEQVGDYHSMLTSHFS